MSMALPFLGSLSALLAGGLLAFQTPDPESVLRGRVIDGDGEPLAGLVVAVHRVTEAGGAEIARTESDAAGRFEIPLAGDDALYFAATRYGDQLHVGAPFRGPPPGDAEYVIVVGAETAIPMGRGPPAEGAAPPEGGSWASWVLLAVAAAGFIVAYTRAGGRDARAERRAGLMALAELEERRAAGEVGSGAYQREREALRRRLDVPAR